MKALLLTSVPKLGRAGDIVNVADGYFRNVLMKQHLAIPATAQHQKQADARDAAEKQKKKEEASKWKELFERLKTHQITLRRKANPQGHLFARISPTDISSQLSTDLGGVSIDSSWVRFDEPIKKLGDHTVNVTIPNLPIHTIQVSVIAE